MGKYAFFVSAPVIGGVEKVMITYANAFAALGHDTSFVICQNSVLGGLLSDQVRIVDLNVGKSRNSVRPLADLFKREKYDAVYCSNVQTLFVLIARVLSHSKTKIISSQHFYCNNVETPFYYKYLLRSIYNSCDAVIAVSHGIQEELVKTIKVEPRKVRLLTNPINMASTIRDAKAPTCALPERYIVWVGRMYAVKNLKLLIESYACLKQSNTDVKLVIVGDGADFEGIKDLAASKVLNDDVIFVGAQQNPYPFIQKSIAVALSSSSEAYPTVLLEALSLGKTVASTPTNGACEILKQGKFGYISKDHTIEEFTKSLQLAINKPFDSAMLVEEALKSDTKTVVNKLLEIFQKL